MADVTHAALVQIAARWLRKTVGATVVLSELVTTAQEIPDAIGWKIGQRWSWAVECKTSRADFFADLKKPHRLAGLSLGLERYYLTPRGTLKPEELPEGWGLLEWTGTHVRVTVPHPRSFKFNGTARFHEIPPTVEGEERRQEYRRLGAEDDAIRALELPLVLSALRRHRCAKCEGEIDGRAERIRDAARERLVEENRKLRTHLRLAQRALAAASPFPMEEQGR